MQHFQGRTAVVTGAASGIGRAVATRLAREGMSVVLADIERSVAAHVASDEETRFYERTLPLLANQGIDPTQVAGVVFDAIRTCQFWVLTHPEWKKVLRERVEALAENGRLTRGFGG